jgi:hypothetical protein
VPAPECARRFTCAVLLCEMPYRSQTQPAAHCAPRCGWQAEDAALAKAEAALQDELRRVKVEEAVLQQQLRSAPEQSCGRAP